MTRTNVIIIGSIPDVNSDTSAGVNAGPIAYRGPLRIPTVWYTISRLTVLCPPLLVAWEASILSLFRRQVPVITWTTEARLQHCCLPLAAGNGGGRASNLATHVGQSTQVLISLVLMILAVARHGISAPPAASFILNIAGHGGIRILTSTPVGASM